ncbi:MAG: hypothetical protein ACTH1Z_02925 [Ancrocorticia sp.]|uniref:hypothetical protein n=1 Tax=Ancrocorticia sp. TaxID=2593684 RepID=UPI003F8ED8C2
MIATLFHHEFLTTRRALLSITAWFFVVGVIALVPVAIPIPFVDLAGNLIALACFILLVPVLMGYLVYNYWQTMYGRRGYFTMTLPMRGRAIYWAKTCYAITVTLAGTLAAAAGLFVTSLAADIGGRSSLGTTIGQIWENVTGTYGNAVGALVLLVGVQVLCLLLTVPAMMSISAQARFNRLGIGAPVIGAIVLYLTYQVSSLIAMMFVPLGLRMQGPQAGTFVAEGMWPEVSELMSTPASSADSMPEILGLGMLFSVAVLTVWIVWWGIRSIERRTSLR